MSAACIKELAAFEERHSMSSGGTQHLGTVTLIKHAPV
jgi:hypothetical protein